MKIKLYHSKSIRQNNVADFFVAEGDTPILPIRLGVMQQAAHRLIL
jgi:hypothetical protein